MAGKKNTPEKPQEPGGLPPELMVNGQSNPESQQSDSGDEQRSDLEHGTDNVYVVTKGRCVQHDGELYRETQQILLDDTDAVRLIDLGVVMTLEAVREMLAKANPPGTVTINGR
ncbi:TPA: hypothetical protein ACRRX0_001432 [Morganella morganii]